MERAEGMLDARQGKDWEICSARDDAREFPRISLAGYNAFYGLEGNGHGIGREKEQKTGNDKMREKKTRTFIICSEIHIIKNTFYTCSIIYLLHIIIYRPYY